MKIHCRRPLEHFANTGTPIFVLYDWNFMRHELVSLQVLILPFQNETQVIMHTDYIKYCN